MPKEEDRLAPPTSRTKGKASGSVLPVLHGQGTLGETEIVFPQEIRFGGSLLQELKGEYRVSQWQEESG